MATKRIINILRENNIDCLPNERFTLDVEMFMTKVKSYPFLNKSFSNNLYLLAVRRPSLTQGPPCSASFLMVLQDPIR
jgi:hypothetical protein